MTTATSNSQTQFGVGVPVGTAPNGTRYFDTTNAVFVEYICMGGVWSSIAGSGGGSYLGVVAVAALPAASAGNIGFTATVNDSNAALTAGIGAIVAGGGANVVPVVSDGVNWRIG